MPRAKGFKNKRKANLQLANVAKRNNARVREVSCAAVEPIAKKWSRSRPLVPMFHDETTTYANDPEAREWVLADGSRCGGGTRKKGAGMAIMLSGYACPCHPHLLQQKPPPVGALSPTRPPLYEQEAGAVVLDGEEPK
jgi:hypothetical protein